MHGCGHDGHVAIGLTVARALAQIQGFSGTLRLIFQPAEEGGRGAVPIIDAGMLDDVDFLFVAHLGCFLGSGRLAIDASGFVHSTKQRVTFHGTASHAAMAPQLGCNALLAGATAALNLHAISRVAGEETFVNVGKMTSGTTFNIIADQCELLLEVRAETGQGHHYMLARAAAVIAGAAQMHGVTHTTEVVAQLNGNHNHPDALAIIDRAARSLPDLEVLQSWPIGGGDDASKMIARVHERGGIGAYFIIGSDITAAHHAQNFDFDEASLVVGRQVFEAIAVQVLGKA
jgi:aminobenzoyl-glutamate utilization protein A